MFKNGALNENGLTSPAKKCGVRPKDMLPKRFCLVAIDSTNSKIVRQCRIRMFHYTFSPCRWKWMYRLANLSRRRNFQPEVE